MQLFAFIPAQTHIIDHLKALIATPPVQICKRIEPKRINTSSLQLHQFTRNNRMIPSSSRNNKWPTHFRNHFIVILVTSYTLQPFCLRLCRLCRSRVFWWTYLFRRPSLLPPLPDAADTDCNDSDDDAQSDDDSTVAAAVLRRRFASAGPAVR